MWLLGYLGGLLRCCHGVSRLPRVFARVMLCSWDTEGGC